MFRRHPILSILLILLIVLIGACALFLATLDLNRYRPWIEQTLSERLKQPVTVEKLGLDLWPQPSLSLSGLEVGESTEEFLFGADQLLINVHLKPLIRGQIDLSDLVLRSPRLRLTVGRAETAVPSTKRPPALPSIDQLLIEDGSFEIIDRRTPGTEKRYVARNVRLRAEDFTQTPSTKTPSPPPSIDQLLIEGDSFEVIEKRTPETEKRYVARNVRLNARGVSPTPSTKTPSTLPSIDQLMIEGDSFEIIDRPNSEAEKRCVARNTRFTAEGLTSDRIELFTLSGQLGEGKTPADVHLKGQFALQPANWLHSHLDLHLKAGPLDMKALPIPLKDSPLEGQGTLEVTLKGSGDSGIDVRGHLMGEGLTLRVPSPVPSPIIAEGVEFSATVLATASTYQLNDLRLSGAPMTLQGTLSLRQYLEGLHIEGEATAFELTLPSSPKGTDPTGPWEKEFLSESTLSLDKLKVATLLDGTELPGLQAHEGDEPGLAGDALSLQCTGELRQSPAVEDAINLPFSLALFLDRKHTENSSLTFDAATTVGNTLLGQMWKGRQDTVATEGKTDLSLHLEGPLSAPRFDLSADLTDLGLQVQNQLNKEPGDAAQLRLKGVRSEEGLKLDGSSLVLEGLRLGASGPIRFGETSGYDLTLDLKELDLQKTHTLLPIIGRLKLSGTLAGRFALQPDLFQGTLKLQKVGMPIKGRLGNLRNLNGKVAITGRRLQSSTMRGLLGSSPITLGLEIDDLSKPRVKAHIESPAMRATDLIFRSKEAYLRDLVGDVVITADEVVLEEVTTRLDRGTRARVEGSISPLHGAPDTLLLIDAEYGNIDEVIALFQGDDYKGDQPQNGNGGAGQVLIDITAKEGILGSLTFTDAQGFLSIDKGVLTLHPLEFRSEPGFFTGMVLWDGSQPPPHPLKISGHLEDFDSEILYHQQLKHKGIVTGKLRGDFYLEGKGVRDEFLKSSNGAFNIEIKNGVLRKFKILSKIFSVLNVSQLLKFQLPDTSSRGMPYDVLTATVLLNNGVLKTDDLFIDSEAMDMTLVGSLDLPRRNLDLTIGIKPLQTVDKIITKIPIAGWLLTGEEKALVTTHFEVKGNLDDPTVRPIPISDVSDKAKGIFKRLFKLPGKLVDDLGRLIEGEQ